MGQKECQVFFNLAHKVNYKKIYPVKEFTARQCYILVISHVSIFDIMLKYFINRKHHSENIKASFFLFKYKNYIMSSMSSLS